MRAGRLPRQERIARCEILHAGMIECWQQSYWYEALPVIAGRLRRSHCRVVYLEQPKKLKINGDPGECFFPPLHDAYRQEEAHHLRSLSVWLAYLFHLCLFTLGLSLRGLHCTALGHSAVSVGWR